MQARNGTGFVPASSLLPDITWLESPHPSQSTVSFSSNSAMSCSAAAESSVLGAAAGQICSSMNSPHGCVSEQKTLKKCNKVQRLKKSSSVSHGSSRCASTAHSLAAEKNQMQGTDVTQFVLEEHFSKVVVMNSGLDCFFCSLIYRHGKKRWICTRGGCCYRRG